MRRCYHSHRFSQQVAEQSTANSTTVRADTTTTDFPSNILFRQPTWSSVSIDIDRWTFPVCLLLVSMMWWENFIEKNISLCGGKLKIPLRDVKASMHILRQKATGELRRDLGGFPK